MNVFPNRCLEHQKTGKGRIQFKGGVMSCIAIDLHCDCFTTARRESLEENSVKLVKNYFLKCESFSSFKETLKPDDYVAIEATT